jgi:hypothetical protein
VFSEHARADGLLLAHNDIRLTLARA